MNLIVSLTGVEPATFPLGEGCAIQLRHRDLMKQLIADDTTKAFAATRDRTGDLQIFSLTLSQLSYSGIITHVSVKKKKESCFTYRIWESNPCLPGESQLS